MNIIIEQTDADNLEVVIRGNPGNPKIPEIISAINALSTTSKLFLYKNEKEYLFESSEINYFEACGNKIYAYAKSEKYEVRYKLYELAEMLHGKKFIQISKGVLVNVNFILSVEAEFSGNYIATLKDKKTRLIISRKYMKEFRKYIMGSNE